MLAGKNLVITGVVTRDSIAFHVAQRAQELGAMTRAFKMLAGELNDPVFLLAQLNREQSFVLSRALMGAIRAAVLDLDGSELSRAIIRTVDATPDTVPVISPVDRLPGFFIASGFSGHGFKFAPLVGRMLADLADGTSTRADPRFALPG